MIHAVKKASSCVVGRYVLHAEIAFGGTATIHLGRLVGPVGFARTVAIKRLHGTFARDPAFVTMFMDEARLAARIRHPNVASIIDVVAEDGELLLVMDYIHGESLAHLLATASERGPSVDPHVSVRVMIDALSGLHAAHELNDEHGISLGVVHRDISPQNIIVAADGVAHLIDFGIAKATGRAQHTQDGQIKGKLRYMAPEQIECGAVDRRTDIFSAAVVLWEALAGRCLFTGTDAKLVYSVLTARIPPPSKFVPGLPKAVEAVVMNGLERDPKKRFATALEMADALESAMQPATSRAVARWVQELASATLENRAKLISDIEVNEGAARHSSAQRVSGSLPSGRGPLPDPSESSSLSDDSEYPDLAEPIALERHTMPLAVQSCEPLATSSVHQLGDSALCGPQRNHRRWLTMSLAVVAVSFTAALLIVLRAQTQGPGGSSDSASAPNRSPAPIATAANPDLVAPTNHQALDSVAATASVGADAPPTAAESSSRSPALGHPSTSLPDRAAEKDHQKRAGADTRGKPSVRANKPAAPPIGEPPTDASIRTRTKSLYTRD